MVYSCIQHIKYICNIIYIYIYLVLPTTIFYWMFGETTIAYVKNWNHPIETTTNKWMFGVPGMKYIYIYTCALKLCLL